MTLSVFFLLIYFNSVYLRLDNLIFSSTGEVLSVIDWELSTLGDPLTDLAYCCLAHFIPKNFPILPGEFKALCICH